MRNLYLLECKNNLYLLECKNKLKKSLKVTYNFRDLVVGCFGLNGPLRQYFSLYRAVSQREGERKEKRQMREKMSKQPPPAPTASAIGPCPTIIQTSRTPPHWKFTQHLRSTRPPPYNFRENAIKLKQFMKLYFMFKQLKQDLKNRRMADAMDLLVNYYTSL